MNLDPRLARDTRPLLETEHAVVLLMNDSRWPWLILVPPDARVTELHHLEHAVRDGFMHGVAIASAALQAATGCTSTNVAMLGNIVAQLHCHVVARSPGDPNWPSPVWGYETAEPYAKGEEPSFLRPVVTALQALL